MSYLELLSKEQQELIVKHLELVIEANKVVNLTRIESIEEGLVLHVEDSLSALDELKCAPKGRYADIGSGGGYPGIPLSIATGRETVLIDSRQKKMKIVESILEKIGIEKQVKVFAGRAELYARNNSSCFSVITARALAKLSVIMELASPLLVDGGHLVCYKSQIETEEENAAHRAQSLTGMKKISDRSFVLDNEYERRIVVFEKQGKSKLKLPRLEGEAQRKPLGYK